ncbi:hypothetical protein AMATHDRAFT_5231 [Amanita thiersii Skay4041]|uniref:DUF6534 domain-containing protein n=1 Tax=Amanita thiersii Skay4041 TaxID=703135 RepID=A0A2A9NMW1_9AGAR|nr:hypothetical protein AMATHDRAFT_5231 [Amanita thiersii Skay4041]
MDASLLDLVSNVEIALIVSSAIWGMTTLQIMIYYRNVSRDGIPFKFMVGVIWACNTVYSACVAIAVYKVTATKTQVSLNAVSFVIPFGSIFGSFVQSAVQAIYAFRIFRLSKSLYIPIACWSIAMFNFVVGMTFDLLIMNRPLAKMLHIGRKLNWLGVSWYGSTAAVDVLITGTLCYLNAGFDRRTRMVDKLALWIIQTGLVTSLLAVVIMIVATLPDITKSVGPWAALTAIITNLYPLMLISLLNGSSTSRTLTTPADEGFDSISFAIPPEIRTSISVDVEESGKAMEMQKAAQATG